MKEVQRCPKHALKEQSWNLWIPLCRFVGVLQQKWIGAQSSPRPSVTISEIDRNIAEAKKEEENEKWSDGLHHYSEAIELLDEEYEVKRPEERSAKVDEEGKHKALECWIGRLHCKVEMMRLIPELMLHDIEAFYAH